MWLSSDVYFEKKEEIEEYELVSLGEIGKKSLIGDVGLIVIIAGKKRVAYVITERGVTALKTPKELETTLDSLHGSALKLCGSPLL